MDLPSKFGPKFKICKRFLSKETKLPFYDLKTGIKSNKKHYLSFITTQPITILGFGIYGTITEKTLDVEYGIYDEDFCNPINRKTILRKSKETLRFDGHRDVYPLFFSSPVNLISFNPYILYFDADSYQTYRGTKGKKFVGVENLKFDFNNDFDSISLSNPCEGNFPEIYFKFVEKKPVEPSNEILPICCG